MKKFMQEKTSAEIFLKVSKTGKIVIIETEMFCFIERLPLNPLQPGVAYLYPLKTSEKTLGFLMFTECIDKHHRAVVG